MKSLRNDLAGIVSEDRVLTEPEDMIIYASDTTFFLKKQPPDAVVLPLNEMEVSRLLKYAYANDIPVTPRGAGTGLEGGCTPVRGGIVLDMKKMCRIVEIDRGNMTARVESGVVLAGFQGEVERMGLFYPPDPQSMSVCTLGGTVSTRAGGARGVKYGTTPNYVLGMEVVLSDGSILTTGSKCVKHSVGYDLTHLLTGAEGTLGVITKIDLRLIPLPKTHQTMIVAVDTLKHAAEVVSEIIAGGTVPAMLEYISQIGMAAMNASIPHPIDTSTAGAFLLMEIDGSEAQVKEDVRTITKLCLDMKASEVKAIEDEKEAKAYWKARANLGASASRFMERVIMGCVAVPRNRLPELVESIQEISASTGVFIGVAGHAGDGNLHPTLLVPKVDGETDRKNEEATDRIMKKTLELGGTISGEHGIGLQKSKYLGWQYGEEQVELMKAIKKAFDPKGIINPGKIWPDE